MVNAAPLLNPNSGYPRQQTNPIAYPPIQQAGYSHPAGPNLYPPSAPMQQQLYNSPYPTSHNTIPPHPGDIVLTSKALYPEQPPPYPGY